jgi:hypothetical protein
MPYDVLLVDERSGRAVGENVLLSALPTNPKVFALYYPGSTDSETIEERLRTLGRKTGENLWVNLGSLGDPDYQQVAKLFRIEALPVVVLTAVSPLAGTPEGDTAFVRLDSEALFARPEDLLNTIESIFNLFLSGQLRRAMVTGWFQEGKARLSSAAERLWSVIRPVIIWASKKDISVEFAGTKIEVKESG